MIPVINIHSHRKPGPREWVLRNAWLPASLTTPSQAGYFASVGVHPWRANSIRFDAIENRLLPLLEQEQVRAVGEIGLDKVNGPDLSIQKKTFAIQLEFAKKYNKPVIIHCVKAYADLPAYIKKYRIPFILHDYSANPSITEELLKFDHVFFSLGRLLFRNENQALERLTQIPSDRIFFETDTMALPIQDVYAVAARLLSVEPETLYKTTFDNFARIM